MYMNRPLQFDYDSQTRSLYVWDQRKLHIVATRPNLCSRVLGDVDHSATPWSDWPQIGLGRLLKYVEKNRKETDDPWTADTFSKANDVTANAESLNNFVQVVGVQRIKKISRLSGRLGWIALLLLERFPAAEQLLNDFPQMFYALTARVAGQKNPEQALKMAGHALALKPADVRVYLHLPATTIVKKIYAPAIRPRLFHRFCQETCRSCEVTRIIRHSKSVGASTMKLVGAGNKVFQSVHNRVFAELGEKPDRRPFWANKILVLLELLNEHCPTQQPTVIHSIGHAAKLWGKFDVGLYYPDDPRLLRAALSVRFPRPPFESRWLRPISDAQEMIQLALAARNCLFLHRPEVVCGDMYFYVMPPNLLFSEMAIVQVVRSKSDPEKWVVKTIEGHRNRKPAEEHCRFIEHEVEKAQECVEKAA